MQGLALIVREVVTLVVRNEVDNRPLGQSGRLVENEPPVLDTRLERAHVATVRVSAVAGKRVMPRDGALRSAESRKRSGSWPASGTPIACALPLCLPSVLNAPLRRGPTVAAVGRRPGQFAWMIWRR